MGKWGSLSGSDEPFRVEIIDPETGEVIKDKAGNPAYIEVHATDSSRGRRFDKDERALLLENARKGKPVTKQVDALESNIAKLAALTSSWYLVDPATQEQIDVPCTIENATELYSLPLTTWLFIQPWAAANNHANFTRRSADNSTSMQSGTSSEAAG